MIGINFPSLTIAASNIFPSPLKSLAIILSESKLLTGKPLFLSGTIVPADLMKFCRSLQEIYKITDPQIMNRLFL